MNKINSELKNIKITNGKEVNSSDLLYYGFFDKLLFAPSIKIEGVLYMSFLCFSLICIGLAMVLITVTIIGD